MVDMVLLLMELNRHQHLPMEAMDHHTLRRLHQEIHPRIHELIQSKLLEDLKDLTLEPKQHLLMAAPGAKNPLQNSPLQ